MATWRMKTVHIFTSSHVHAAVFGNAAERFRNQAYHIVGRIHLATPSGKRYKRYGSWGGAAGAVLVCMVSCVSEMTVRTLPHALSSFQGGKGRHAITHHSSGAAMFATTAESSERSRPKCVSRPWWHLTLIIRRLIGARGALLAIIERCLTTANRNPGLSRRQLPLLSPMAGERCLRAIRTPQYTTSTDPLSRQSHAGTSETRKRSGQSSNARCSATK